MSYQKPTTPQQRFDKPVYQELQPKKKTEKKRPFLRKTRRAEVSIGNTKPPGSKKPAAGKKSIVSATSKKRPSSVKPAQRVTARKARA